MRIFSAASGMDKTEAEKIRNYLMGWSPTSKTAAKYTLRYTEKKAHEALVAIQNKMFKTNQ